MGEEKKAKVAFMQASSCWGCHQSLLDAHLGLLQVLPLLDIVYWPAVVDFKHQSLVAREDGSVDVGFYEGIVRTKQDHENLLLMRKKCKTLISFGSCPTFGSVAGLANLYNLKDLEARKFKEAETITETKGTPTEHMPGFMENVYPASHYAKMDVSLPGCPPTTENIVDAVLFLLGKNPDFKFPEKSVCDECERNKPEKVLKELKRDFEGLPDPDECLINQGYICFGMATLSGCGGKCVKANAPCLGCYGPTPNVTDHGLKIMTSVSSMSELEPEDLEKFFSDPAGYFNRFTLPHSTLNRKIKDNS